MTIQAPDVLLDLLLASRAPVSTRALIRAGTLLGLGNVAIRVALSRLVAERKIARIGRGSYVTSAQDGGVFQAISDWPNKHALAGPWNGDWIAVHDAEIGRSDKVAWRHHRLALDLWGLRPLRAGLHVRPANLRCTIEEFSARLGAVGLGRRAVVLHVASLPPAVDKQARRLWNAAELVAHDRQLLARLSASLRSARRSDRAKWLAESFLLGREVIAYLVRDPILPPELMPSRSRAALLDAARDYQQRARALWQQWLAED